MMNIFINNLGSIRCVQVEEGKTLAKLSKDINLPTNCRLSYAGKILSSHSQDSTLSTLRLQPNSTVVILLPLVGGMSKCHLSGCSIPVARLIGSCRWCRESFCAQHRLPESHECSNLQSCKQQSHEKNSDKLMNGKCVSDKV